MATQVDNSPWTLKRLLEWTSDYLAKAAVDQPRLCAEILLAEVMKCQRIELYMAFDKVPTPDQLSTYRDWVKRCSKHEPVAYLIGRQHFFSLEFKVSPAVLVPRPETEVLVTQALAFLNQSNRPTLDVLDLCTGSGCVAVALAQNFVEAEFIASDISAEALAVAAENIARYDLGPRVKLCQSDLFDAIESSGKGIFDLIVSNPPYISAPQYAKLDKNVRDYEPPMALRGGEDGLDFYRRIVRHADKYLADDAALMVEVAYDQAEAVTELFQKCGYLNNVQTARDALGHHRVVSGIKN